MKYLGGIFAVVAVALIAGAFALGYWAGSSRTDAFWKMELSCRGAGMWFYNHDTDSFRFIIIDPDSKWRGDVDKFLSEKKQ